MHQIFARSALVLALASAGVTAHAAPLLDGFGGSAGYGELAMLPNDDGSSNQINLPFAINFFGNSYDQFYINNNGNITFNGSVSTYTPNAFPISSQPMIAPYWGDVDTRGTGAVYVAAPNTDTVVITWNNVGYFSSHTDKVNNFQLILTNRADTGAGNFDVTFRYDQLEWTTGDASGGSGGLGGTPAQAGYDAGNGVNFFTLPGSRTADVLMLADTSNVSLTTPGLWSFAIRDGGLPDGSTSDNPLLPVVTDNGFQFDFDVVLNQQVFIDPLVAVGYDYIVDAGPDFASVLIPATSLADTVFELIVEGLSFTLNTDTAFDFVAELGHGVSSFRIQGIDPNEALDPTDTTAFVTGLTFTSAGSVSMRQVPVTLNTDPSQVPLPGSLALMAIGALALRRRRH